MTVRTKSGDHEQNRGTYRKVLTRDMELMACEYWYQGESVELAKLTEGSFYFKPMFVYQPGKATSGYYDFTDPAQAPVRLLNYLQKHPDAFDKWTAQWLKTRDELLECVKRKDKHDFERLFRLIARFWPLMDCAWALCDATKAPKELAKKAYELRAQTEKVVYDAGFTFYELAQQIVPPAIRDDVFFMAFEEVLQGQRVKDVVQRKKGYVYFEGRVFTPESLEQFAKEHNIRIETEQPPDVHEVKGTIACTGLVRGKAKIVLERAQLGKVETGDILISSMTTPDFLPAMKKAAAFVTDEGGITCHAAIVAREMKKPCVIGTRIATKVFKDGDEVEIDAVNGIVRKLT